ncbi:MAG: hypothetical protein KUG64_10815, partial [Cycloclasticus sp.]|nr:hypothetical protein [Cycloclasticus sp.]
MAIEHPRVHAWFGAGGEAILQVLRVVKRRYVLMVLKGRTDCVPVPKTIRERDETGERSVSLSKRVVV